MNDQERMNAVVQTLVNSLRDQFATKVAAITLGKPYGEMESGHEYRSYRMSIESEVAERAAFEKFLLDLARNAAQGLAPLLLRDD